MNKFRNSPYIFYLYYFVIFFGTAIQSSFLNMYLNHAGMPSSVVGLVNGLSYVISFIVFPIYGAAADRASSKNKVLIIGMVASILLLMVFSVVKSVLLLAIVMIVFTVLHNPLTGIYEAIAVEKALKSGWNYGPIRMSGTIGYAVMALFSGYGLSKNEALIFPIYILSMVLATVIACLLPKTKGAGAAGDKGAPRQKADPRGIIPLLKVKKIRNVLLLFMLYHIGTAFKQTYYGIYMTQLGGTYSLVGIANMLMAFSELPFYLGPGKRWMKKIGIEKSMLLIAAAGTIRWLIVGVCRTPGVLVFTMMFNGIMLVPTVVGMVEFLHENAPDDLKASAQTTLRAPFQVGGQLIGAVLGGWLVGVLDGMGLPGIRIGFALLSPLSLVMGLAVGWSVLKDAKKGPRTVKEA